MKRSDIEVLKFVEMLNELSEKSKNGIKSFDEATYDNFGDYIFYGPKSKKENVYHVVMSACLGADHHDIIDYYDNYCGKDYSIYVTHNEKETYCIEIDLYSDSDDKIVIENGKWYFI